MNRAFGSANSFPTTWCTLFHYKCTKSMSQTFNHPLQYEVRFLQDIEFPEHRMRKRIVHREKRPVAQCP